MNHYLPHQERVVKEKDELVQHINALYAFITSPLFKTVNAEEQGRLRRQESAMTMLADILCERIMSFTPLTQESEADTALPNTSGMIPMHVNVPQQDAPIESLDQFAALVDYWHQECMEHGNRVIQLGAEGVIVTVEDDAKPGEVTQITLDVITAQIFRLGAMSALNVFKDLPFGASLEEAPSDDAAS